MTIFTPAAAVANYSAEELESNLADSALWLAVEAEAGFFEDLPHISTVERSQIWIDTVLDFAEFEALDILGNPKDELEAAVRSAVRELRTAAQAEFTATQDIHGVTHSIFNTIEEREACTDESELVLSRALRLLALIVGRDLRG